ncbi:hypothetical protein EV360DRAFT_70327 [Lentinula raphanica]|nr:hypothetical protein EV360DRAFT_70327 [Lentinula raphanica]
MSLEANQQQTQQAIYNEGLIEDLRQFAVRIQHKVIGLLSDLRRTKARCEQLVNLLEGRSRVVAFFMQRYDLRKVETMYEEVKIRRDEIEVCLPWLACIVQCSPTANIIATMTKVYISPERAQKQECTVHLPSIYTVPPSLTLSHAVVSNSTFNAVRGNMYSSTVSDRSQYEGVFFEGAVIHNLQVHYHGSFEYKDPFLTKITTANHNER